MKRGATGDWKIIHYSGETVRAFVPRPLPPAPPLVMDLTLQREQEHALAALGRLDAITGLLPDARLFLYHYVRREAVLSSQIEGTQSSLSDLLRHEIHGSVARPNDVLETSLYVAAQEHGLRRMRGNFPLSNRLLREMHRKLMARGRGSRHNPGEFRRSQNWIGGARPATAHYVPPPHARVESCMSALEKFIHNENMPVLTRAALAHVQFETIHPFLDGNGRIGRLLIAMILHQGKLLQKPLLYLSLYFKRNRRRYYELLDETRRSGDWENWLRFFYAGVGEVAAEAVDKARQLTQLFARDRERVAAGGTRASFSVSAVHRVLCARPMNSVAGLAKASGLSFPTVQRALVRLAALRITRELTGARRGRIFVYTKYLRILNEGTEEPPDGA